MGNVPAKESGSRGNSYSSSPTTHSDLLAGRLGRRGISSNVFPTSLGDLKKSKKQEEKDKQRDQHYLNLIVNYTDNVDGGFLAPFGVYKSNLDYDTEIVRELIVNRLIAPFYTPLQDFDDSWTDEELILLLGQQPLHSIEAAFSEEEEDDVDNHKIHKSSNYYKRQEQKAKLKSLVYRIKDLQKEEESKFLEQKQKLKNGDTDASPDLPSKDLLLRLYRNASECPICFLYYPPNFNISRCCVQPICTECFVQIKRLDPHPPHDDSSNEPGSDELPHSLISEAANCPYCALPNFGVTYDHPKDLNTGVNGIKPSRYSAPFKSIPEGSALSSSPESDSGAPHVTAKLPRRTSIAADGPGVITTDMIRPDWEIKLNSARSKLARKAATASAIHASNLIMDDDECNDASRRRSTHNNSSRRRHTHSSSSRINPMEERMIEEALRLSLVDEEERKKKVELEERRKKLPST
ncbi:uncharacterized protein PRCAT00002157001 [Priceomyces carsonii]|uniref:uncharacterized protein n=1 Tax=Priceomyces carsonii TaxID=28549 RepID=UPI002ED9F572|nr:unnamed protein product [Priceomyces carsonii]